MAEKSAPTEPEWTAEDLKSAKPIMVYYYVEGMDASNGAKDPSFKFAQSFEMGGLGERVVKELNDNWKCKKVGLDLDADRKEEKNQARIELWSITGVKLGVVGLKSDLSQSGLMKAFKTARAKNTAVCAKEIKRLAELEKAREKAEKEQAEKDAEEVAAK